MSRLTTNPFHRPSPFEFPRAVQSASQAAAQPISPPETNDDFVGPAHSHLASSMSAPMPALSVSPAVQGGELDRDYQFSAADSASGRFRTRVSTLAYHSTGILESRERTVQRNSKSFIIVLPPSTFLQDHGQLGHTLSSGPRHRLSQGILMPLFPTMYGQLSAIAREFNFPSTAGLCLYLHFTDNEVTVTPRISDDAWPFMWAHAFESHLPPSRQIPISGTVEFDIDLHQARWYASWVSSSRRDSPTSMSPSRAPTVSHFRGESRTTFVDDNLGEEQPDTRPTSRASRIVVPTSRHVPRKLSLVDRFESTSVRSGSRPASRATVLSPPEQASGSNTLSPIVQEEEPKTAKIDLERRVNSWRASASLTPTPLATKGQTSLEPANLPNEMDINESLIPIEDELNLDDFTWSISSAGPGDDELESLLSWDRLPSVHILDRMRGSVCLTPSDCTSFGPFDYEMTSPVSSFYRLPSPDLGYRMLEDAPPTPSTATSWGAPLYYPESPMSDFRALSVDIGERNVFSRPVTPTTATSWGAPSWPSSPVSSDYRPRSVHLGDRGEFSRPATPSTATSWGAPLSYPPSPSTPYYVHTPDAGQRSFDPAMTRNFFRSEPLQHPVLLLSQPPKEPRAWNHVWPYFHGDHVLEEYRRPISVHLPSSYGIFNLYPAAYPEFDLYPANPFVSEVSGFVGYPHFNLYPDLHTAPLAPTRRTENPKASSVQTPSPAAGQRSLDAPITRKAPRPQPPQQHVRQASRPQEPRAWHHVWPYFQGEAKESAGYPHFNLYPDLHTTPSAPKTRRTSESSKTPISIRLPAVYPNFDLYPSTYPGNLDSIYPTIVVKHEIEKTTSQYPDFNLYPSVIPVILRSSSVPNQTRNVSSPTGNNIGTRAVLSVYLSGVYPVFNLYPAIYPAFDLYPSIEIPKESSAATYPHFDLYPATAPQQAVLIETSLKVVSVRLSAVYPAFSLYPPIYPYFELWPTVPAVQDKHSIVEASNQGYPNFEIYPAMKEQGHQVSSASTPKALSMRLIANYPAFDLYPAIYPIFEIYPALPKDKDVPAYPHFDLYPALKRQQEVPSAGASKMLSVRLDAQYPVFNLYPAVYPVLEIYPALPKVGSVPSRYPHFHLYPSVSVTPTVSNKPKYQEITTKLPASYPAFDLYPPVYPYFELWPTISVMPSITNAVKMENPSRQGYPDFDIYPTVKREEKMTSPRASRELSVRLDASYPVFNLYPAVYPNLEIYPVLAGTNATLQVHSQIDSSSPVSVVPKVSSKPKYEEITVKLPATYPAFDLYPSVYPYFELWPIVIIAEIMPPPKIIPVVRKAKSGRLTHSELHAIVMMGLSSERSQESHKELHQMMFPDGIMSTPAQTILDMPHPEPPRAKVSETPAPAPISAPRPRSRGESFVEFEQDPPQVPGPVPVSILERKTSISHTASSSRGESFVDLELEQAPLPSRRRVSFAPTRARSGSVSVVSIPPPPPPSSSPQRTLPTPPSRSNSLNRKPSAFEATTTISPLARPRGLPSSPSDTVRSRPVSVAQKPVAPPVSMRQSPTHGRLPSVEERHPPSAMLNRSRSTVLPSSRTNPVSNGNGAGLDRSVSTSALPPRPIPQKRDSLVLQRVKAYSAATNDEPSLTEALSKFPMPPRPPVPPVPTVNKLDQSKYRFAN